MDLELLGRLMLFGGLAIAAGGAMLLLLSRIPGLGHLPGDIQIQTENFSCFVPIVSMIVLSIIATIVVNIVIRLLNR